jgi:acetyl-CoA carboxylase biotin carboxyl carrier protein
VNFEELCALIELVSKKGLSLVEVEQADVKVRIRGTAPAAPMPPVPDGSRPSAAAPGAAFSGVPAPPSSPAAEDPNLHLLPSPMVGTFYRAPSPQAEPFVKVGDRVRKGQVLCIIEAMKLMNEIEADRDGEVAAIYPANAQPVEFGEKLFALALKI